MKTRKRILGLVVALMLLFTMPTVANAHSGRTDSSGGHRDNKNKSGLGYYHYHHGYGPHLHKNGICPYSPKKIYSKPKTTVKRPSVPSKISGTSVIKAAQVKLNYLGYNSGSADGIMGNKTKTALKKFQKDHRLIPDGIIGPITRKALGI